MGARASAAGDMQGELGTFPRRGERLKLEEEAVRARFQSYRCGEHDRRLELTREGKTHEVSRFVSAGELRGWPGTYHHVAFCHGAPPLAGLAPPGGRVCRRWARLVHGMGHVPARLRIRNLNRAGGGGRDRRRMHPRHRRRASGPPTGPRPYLHRGSCALRRRRVSAVTRHSRCARHSPRLRRAVSVPASGTLARRVQCRITRSGRWPLLVAAPRRQSGRDHGCESPPGMS